MNNEYDVLLEKFLEGSLTESERSAMEKMEQEDPELAELRQAHELLQDELQSLGADVPEMPSDFHAAWTAKIEEEASMQETKKPGFPRIARILSLAAALVVLVGGTILARDALPPRSITSVSDDDISGALAYKSSAPETAAFGLSAASLDNGVWAAEETAAMDYDADEAYESEADTSNDPVSDQKIIRTGSITLSTTEFDRTMSELRERISRLDGTITWSSISTGYNGLHSATLTIRIPSENFDAFYADIPASGTVTSQSQQVDDVTESYRDREARLATQKALLARLHELMGQAGSLGDLLELESQIADTQYQIDTLTASLAKTDQQVIYSTVSVYVNEEKPRDTISRTTLSFGERISRALSAGLTGFVEFMEDLVLFLLAALPYLILLAVLAAVVFVIIRRRRRKHS